MNGKNNDPKKCYECGGPLCIIASGCTRYGISASVWCPVCNLVEPLEQYWQSMLAVPDTGDPCRELDPNPPRVTVSNDPNDDPLRGSYRR